MKSRDKEIDALKGVLIIIVVLRHIFQVVSTNAEVDYLSNLITAVQMPLFMIISGFFGGKSIFTEEIKLRDLKKILLKKTRAYFIPFISFYIIFKIIFVQDCNVKEKISLLIGNITLGLWFLYVIWILSMLINTSIYFSCKYRKNDKVKRYFVFVSFYFMVIALLGIVGMKIGIDFMGIKFIIYYSIFYMFGYHLKYIIEIKHIIMNDSIAAISTIVFFIGCYFFKILIMPDNLFNTSFRVILALTSSHTLFRCVKYIINSKIGQLFSYIGMYTLEIYYIHSFLLRVVSIEPEEILFSYNALIKAGFMTIFMIIIIPIIIVLIKNNKILSLLIFGKRNRRG